MYAHLFTPERRTGWLIFLHGILFYTTRFQLLFSKANDFVGARFSLEHGGETISRITYVHWSKYIWHSQPTLPSEGVYGGFSLTGWVCQPLPSWTREMACSPIPSASLWPGIQKDHASLGNPKEHPGVVFFGSKTINEFWANPKISKVSSPIKIIKYQPVIWSSSWKCAGCKSEVDIFSLLEHNQWDRSARSPIWIWCRSRLNSVHHGHDFMPFSIAETTYLQSKKVVLTPQPPLVIGTLVKWSVHVKHGLRSSQMFDFEFDFDMKHLEF